MLAGLYNRDNARPVLRNSAAVHAVGLSYAETRNDPNYTERSTGTRADLSQGITAAGASSVSRQVGAGAFVMQVSSLPETLQASSSSPP